ncbi:MAG: hypothetical protein GX672_08645 [Synergistaceae bacterium]|nr:hypothetical protein [Synergistaceae bacterium]
MKKESEMSKEMLKVALETAQTMEWEGMRRHQKELALMETLSNPTSKQRRSALKKSENAVPEKQNEPTTGGATENGTQNDWLMERLRRGLPHLTDEEIIKGAGGLLG